MKKRACISVLALSLIASILTVAPASAKLTNGMRAQIPFDFQVGNVSMSAGKYTVNSITQSDSALLIRSVGGNASAITLTNAMTAKVNSRERARLVFHKYGDQYFLVAVWGAQLTGHALPESKRERNLRNETRIAKNSGSGVEVVTIYAD